jgi:hypothetical protein
VAGQIERIFCRDPLKLLQFLRQQGGRMLKVKVRKLMPYDPAFKKKMKKGEEIIRRYRNTLRALAK